jgi:hypothetical protein
MESTEVVVLPAAALIVRAVPVTVLRLNVAALSTDRVPPVFIVTPP